MIHDTLWTVECDKCGCTWEYNMPYWETVGQLESMLVDKGWDLTDHEICPDCCEDDDAA